MTDLQYQIMTKVFQNQPCDDDIFTADEHIILNECARNHWIRWTRQTLRIVVTERGKAAMLEHEYHLEQMRKERAEQEAEEHAAAAQRVIDEKKSRIHDLKLAVFSVLAAYVVEHFFEIVDFFKSLINI